MITCLSNIHLSMINGAKDGHLTNTSPCHISIAKIKNTNTQLQIQIEIDKCLKNLPLIRETFKISYTFPVIISA